MMTTVQLKGSIQKQVRRKETIRPALRALVCDHCGDRFDMRAYCNDQCEPARLFGTFSGVAFDAGGRSLGNMFSATVCSFPCAHAIHKGGWKKLKGYAPHAKQKLELVRVELGLTTKISEAEMLAEWKKGTYAPSQANPTPAHRNPTYATLDHSIPTGSAHVRRGRNGQAGAS